MSNRAWVTLATNDSYGLGALVLAHSLRRVGSAAPAVVLITPAVTEAMRTRLGEVFAEVITVDVLDSGDAAHLALLQRPELGITFTKLHCWNLTQYDKCVFLDADTLIVQNCDELFDREELSAAPDVGWPDCFNSGVFVYKPSAETFNNLVKFAQERGSFDGGDQGLLNLYFSDWAHGDINKHLPYLYNVTSAAFYSYLPALKQYGKDLKIIHFIGAAKPWLQHFNWRTGTVDAPEHLREFLQLWWNLFVAEVHTKLDTSMVEVETPPPAIPQHEPEYAEEVLNTGFYEATLNPHSEFPWHHPDNQIQNTESEPIIDMTEFHDPWNIYKGHIPPITDDNQEQPKEDYYEVRKHAWEYMPPVYAGNQKNYTPSQIESPFAEARQSQDTHYTHEEYISPQSENHHTDDYQQENHHTDPTSQHYFHEQSHTEYSHRSEYCEPKTFINHNYEHNTEPPNRYTLNQSNHKQNDESYTNNLNIHRENTSHYNNVTENKKSKHAIFSRPQEIIQNRTPYVYSVHLDHCVRNENDAAPNVNGYVSDDEYEQYEETPRHPYDGYYLRHRNTIDSRGRKVCSHQIPHLPHSPSPSPTPPDSPEVFEDALAFPEEINEINWENHTGVASHLARIGQDLQSEAVDELIRRQGWEAGNIDYMGADSFANIWAKISDTLSKAPSPPPKQQSPPAVPPPVVPQSSVGGKDSSPLKETPPVPAEADSKSLPLEEPLPVPVETDTKQLAPEESLPASDTTDTKGLVLEEPIPQSLETDPKKAPVEELTPVSIEPPQQEKPEPIPVESETQVMPSEVVPIPVETDTKQLAPEESLPAPTEADTKVLPTEASPVSIEPATKVLPSETSPVTIEADTKVLSSEDSSVLTEAGTNVLPSEASPVTIETDTKVLSSEDSSVLTEAGTNVLSSETSPATVEADTKILPSEDSSVLIEAGTNVPSSETSPATIEADTKVLPSEALSIPIEADTKVLPTEAVPIVAATKEPTAEASPTPVKAATTELPAEDKTMPVQAVTQEQSSEAVPLPVEAATTEPSETLPTQTEPDTKGQTLECAPPQPIQSDVKEVPLEKPVPEPVKPDASPSEENTESVSDVPVSALGALKLDDKKSAASDSPPLATTPSKEDAAAGPAAKSEERRRPAGKLQLHPPSAADPLPTPDSELEDADTLAQSIIASELRTPTVTSPSPTTEPPLAITRTQPSNLDVKGPEVPTPPVGAVSLTQIGIKPKSKPSIAAQIESSVSAKTESIPPGSAPTSPEIEAPKKKLVKKIVKKEKEGASGEAPVPPPRKKEKKPKDK